MKKIALFFLVTLLVVTMCGCGNKKQLGEICNLIITGDEGVIEKIDNLKNVDEVIEYSYIDLPEGIILESDKGRCISLLGIACAVGNEAAINTLLDKGANAGANLDDGLGAYPLEYFCQSGYASGSYLLEKLVDAGGDTDKYIVESPLFRLADNLKTDEENSELLLEEILIILDRDGSWESKSIKHDGENIMHVAAGIDDGELQETLLEYDKSIDYINAKDVAGVTPLMSAVNSDCWNNVVGLIVHGADTQAIDVTGMTAEDMAKVKGNKIILKIFDMSKGLQ